MYEINSALLTALGDVADNCMNLIGTLLPTALGVVGAIIVVRVAIRAFKSVIGR